ncbi:MULTISPECIES: phosphatidate cytidylyltransferase [Comamonadaceae]|jgi:phosphatidate cytidylyltransferase|uniref:phosphatidate cytidylyltransferase n=1 Tax=Comamonadaceae TaxID=80864 RepID=UPI00271E90E1|nr:MULTISPECIES: phosphatidate cytidylyltransferase [Comamonadaceae]MDO9253425.1 phosphatidate cytidylyltransferase [Hydrogenophaga sp.]MDP2442122.1 phosphatidate cytidylyltransferase [Rhodoferax sp.]MDP3886595.1 phosphatidate cytidylyltransferase [Hydrogenophaga sp.]MDZ4175713.1 phosphatidate cytidylyltransferase [Hydrogenophaga sp.]
MGSFLRSLTPEQQVSLMFVLLFGLLLIASGVGVLLSLRERRQADDDTGDRAQRLHDYQALLRNSWLMTLVFWVAWAAGESVAIVLFGLVSFFILREFISLSPTRRGDHRSLVLAFFIVLPLQYALVWNQHFNLFTVFIPVYVFLAIPVVSALGNDPQRFLERNAKLQWGIMVCVYGMSHVPALLWLNFPRFAGKTAFLVVFLVLVVQTCMLIQHLVARRLSNPVAPAISASFHWRSWLAGLAAGGLLGVALAGFTPFKPLPALAMALVACVAGSFGHLVMKAIKRDRGVTHWGSAGRSVTGASGLLDRVDALCFAAPVFFHSVRWTFNL